MQQYICREANAKLKFMDAVCNLLSKRSVWSLFGLKPARFKTVEIQSYLLLKSSGVDSSRLLNNKNKSESFFQGIVLRHFIAAKDVKYSITLPLTKV